MSFSHTTPICDRIKEVRLKSHLSQEDFAKRIGLKRPNYANIETGRQLPTIDQLTCIVREFGNTIENLTYDWLIEGLAGPVASPTASPTASPAPKKNDDSFSRSVVRDEGELVYKRSSGLLDKPDRGEGWCERYIAQLERSLADKQLIIELLQGRLNNIEGTIKSKGKGPGDSPGP